VGAALAWLSLLGAGVGCNLALGLDGYEDVAVKLCGCTAQAEDGTLVSIDFYFSDCQARVRGQLEKAKPAQREKWLGTYDARDCGTCTDLGVELSCLQESPVCRVKGERCGAAFDCCNFLTGEDVCQPSGRCGACLDPGEDCETSEQCCGALGETETAYCFEGKCRREAPACKHTLTPCASDAECCGSEAGLATCTQLEVGPNQPTYCLELCASATAAENCPGCCTGVAGAGLDKPFICIDGPAAASFLEKYSGTDTVCDAGCVLGGDESCPSNKTCQQLPGDGGLFQYCAP
jgi:hypothetical protein